MQVRCNQCGARYEFDASAIPAQGYDAQCTQCGAVFFVQPEKAGASDTATPSAGGSSAPDAGGGVAGGLIAVACGHCGARYEFSPSLIPAGGYVAQCTQCNGVFFVGPPTGTSETETPVAPAPTLPETSAPGPQVKSGGVAALDIGTLQAPGQFQAAVVGGKEAGGPAGAEVGASPGMAEYLEPEEYDVVELSQSGRRPVASAAVFVEAGESLLPEPALTPQEAPGLGSLPSLGGAAGGLQEHQAPQMTPHDAFSTSPTPSSVEAVARAPGERATTLSQAAAQSQEAAENAAYDDLMALDAELGEPLEAPGGVTAENDFEFLLRRRRRKLWGFFLLLVAVAGYGGVTYFLFPRWFDLTVGRFFGIKLTVHPEAVPYAEEGQGFLYKDTTEGYTKAIKSFDAALRVDPLYAKALVYGGLAYVFRGADAQAEGQRIFDVGAEALEEIRAIDAKTEPAPGDLPRRAALLVQAKDAQKRAAESFERAGVDRGRALAMLNKALTHFPDDALVLKGAGIYDSGDSDSLARARRELKLSQELLGKTPTVATDGDADAWALYLQARLVHADGRERRSAAAYYKAAAAKEPRFVRAVYELAVLHEQLGELSASRSAAKAVLQVIPGHDKATALLKRVEAAQAPRRVEPVQKKAPSQPKGRRRRRR